MLVNKGLVCVLLLLGCPVFGTTVRRDLVVQHPGLEFLHLGNFGPISRLPSHPSFTHLGLSPQQAVGFMNILLQNGLLNFNALRHPNGQPFLGDSAFVPSNGNFYPQLIPVDPYILFLMYNYARFLPFGLGPQGIYGSTSLPRPKPLGVFKYNDKNA